MPTNTPTRFFSDTVKEISANRLIYGIVALILAGSLVSVSFFAKHFVKHTIGPLYILEVLAILCLLTIATSKTYLRFFGELNPLTRANFRHAVMNPIFWGLVFTAYCFTHLIYDLTFHSIPSDSSLKQTLQHSLIFIYPVLWISIGMWVSRFYRNLTTSTFILIAALNFYVYLFFTGTNVSLVDPNMSKVAPNLAIGGISFVLTYYAYLKRLYLLSATLLLLSYLPILEMPHLYVHRVSILHMLVLIYVTPFLFNLKNKSALRISLRQGTFFLAILVIGYFTSLMFLEKPQQASQKLENRFIHSFQHADDFPRTGQDSEIVHRQEKTFLFKSRSFWWLETLNLWKEKPIFGVGLIPYVPPYAVPAMGKDPKVKNNGIDSGPGNWISLGKRPLSGPHNSYLNILTRFGIVGLAIFACFLTTLAANIWVEFLSLAMPLNLLLVSRVIGFCIFINSLVYAFWGVGFESPHNAVLGWFAAGTLLNPSALIEYLEVRKNVFVKFRTAKNHA